MFLDGAWQRPDSNELITVCSPATEEEVGFAPRCSLTDVDRAVDSASRAFGARDGWSRWEPERRADVLDRLADVLGRRAGRIARLISSENGMPVSLSAPVEGAGPPRLLRYYAELIRKTEPEECRPALTGSGSTIVRREPAGVVAAVVPWNYPATLTMFKLAPALAAGCTVVLKPAPETVLDACVLAEAVAEAGLPDGVVNVVPGDGHVGAHLVAHPGVDKVSFTGSTTTGRAIARVCGGLLRPVTLELGGRSAAIVLDDADLATAIPGVIGTALVNTGQTCFANTRILAPRGRYAEVLEAVTAATRDLVLGEPLDRATQIGPLVSRRQRDRVESFIESGLATGARLTTGGRRPAGLGRGWYLEPAVFGDVVPGSALAREEIFGPVLTVQPYADVSEAVALADDSDYGLAGTVWTADQQRGLDVARRVHTGTFGVNGYSLDHGAPFGGVKSSGLGRELGPEGLDAYLRLKSIYR